MKKYIFMNKNKILAAGLSFLGLMSLPYNSFASKKATETYAAQEEAASENIANEVSAPEQVAPVKSEPKRVAPKTAAKTAPAPVQETKAEAPAAVAQPEVLDRVAALEKEVAQLKNSKKTAANAFDPVPENQRGAILKRMQLAEKLVHSYGRAYDYRVTTVKELEQILASLEAAHQNEAQPAESLVN